MDLFPGIQNWQPLQNTGNPYAEEFSGNYSEDDLVEASPEDDSLASGTLRHALPEDDPPSSMLGGNALDPSHDASDILSADGNGSERLTDEEFVQLLRAGHTPFNPAAQQMNLPSEGGSASGSERAMPELPKSAFEASEFEEDNDGDGLDALGDEPLPTLSESVVGDLYDDIPDPLGFAPPKEDSVHQKKPMRFGDENHEAKPAEASTAHGQSHRGTVDRHAPTEPVAKSPARMPRQEPEPPRYDPHDHVEANSALDDAWNNVPMDPESEEDYGPEDDYQPTPPQEARYADSTPLINPRGSSQSRRGDYAPVYEASPAQFGSSPTFDSSRVPEYSQDDPEAEGSEAGSRQGRSLNRPRPEPKRKEKKKKKANRERKPRPPMSPGVKRVLVVLTFLTLLGGGIGAAAYTGHLQTFTEQARTWLAELNKPKADEPVEETPELPPEVATELEKRREAERYAEYLHDPQLQLQTVGKLVSIGAPAVDVLKNLLRDPNARVRQLAALALGEIGEPAESAVPDLSKLLDNQPDAVSLEAVASLAKIGPSAVDPLIQALSSSQPRVRLLAMRALGDIGPEAEAALPHLAEMLGDADRNVANEAIRTLADLGPQASDVLFSAIKSDRLETRIGAAKSLAALGRDAEPAMKDLLELMKTDSPQATQAASQTLAAIGTPAVEPLKALLNYPESRVQFAAISALAGVKPEPVAEMEIALRSPDPIVRRGAAEVLGRYGEVAEPAIPTLRRTAADDRDTDVRRYAKIALEQIEK
jgi:HEAT repeat protein